MTPDPALAFSLKQAESDWAYEITAAESEQDLVIEQLRDLTEQVTVLTSLVLQLIDQHF